jgi:hypothetical protein
MSSQFRRLQDLEADVRYRFSIGGVKARHDSPRIRQLINVAWQQLRTIVSLCNDGTFLEPTGALTLPTAPVITGEAYCEIPWPLDAARIFGVRCQTVTSGRWYPLKRVPWVAHHDYQFGRTLETFRRQPGPIAYCTRSIPKGVEQVETTGNIMVMPVPTQGLYRLWYLQNWTPQVEDDDTFSGHSEWFEWIIYSVCIKMLSPDADSKKNYGMWSVERDKCQELIEAEAKALEDGMPVEPTDGRFDGMDPEGAWDAL